MTGRPRVAFGAPLYNNARHLPQAIESLLSQSYENFGVVLVDDCSTDGTSGLAARYAQLDSRVVYIHNEHRLGYIRNARKAFDLARTRFPDIAYFAWASDHDVWHPRWLEALVPILESDAEIVLAYPLSVRISDGGEFRWEPRTFDTDALIERARRFRATFWGMAAGDMIYGLFRRQALEQTGCLSLVLLPDRLLLSELSLYGRFKQVPEVLWYRRYWGLASYKRQRAAFFPDHYPLYSYLPWWMTHGALLFWRLTVRGAGHPPAGRVTGATVSVQYMLLAVGVQIRHSLKKVRRLQKWARKRVSVARKRLLRAWRFPKWVRMRLSLVRKRLVRAWHVVSFFRPHPERTRIGFEEIRRRLARAFARSLLQIRQVRVFVKGYLVPLVSTRSQSDGQQTPVRVVSDQDPRKEILEEVTQTVGALVVTPLPVIAGPWLGSLEHELLYWIPFLHWVKEGIQVPSERIIVASATGAASWYREIAAHYVHVSSIDIPGEEADALEGSRTDRHEHTQVILRPHDYELIDRIKHTLQLNQAAVLHPSVIYTLLQALQGGWPDTGSPYFQPWRWRNTGSTVTVLPAEYVAVKVHWNSWLPDSEANRMFVSDLITALSDKIDVVMLYTSRVGERQAQFVPRRRTKRIHTIDLALNGRNPLEVQTEVLHNAKGFVGTFGRYLFLSMYGNVPSLSLYSREERLLARDVEWIRMAWRLNSGTWFGLMDASKVRPRAAAATFMKKGIAHVGRSRRPAGD